MFPSHLTPLSLFLVVCCDSGCIKGGEIELCCTLKGSLWKCMLYHYIYMMNFYLVIEVSLCNLTD